jgi:hypothetical protein
MSINQELYTIIVSYKEESRVNILKTASNVSTIKTCHQEELQSFWEFLAKYFIARASENTKILIELPPHYSHYALFCLGGLSLTLITGAQYPELMAQLALYRTKRDFESLIPIPLWAIPGKLKMLYTSLPLFLQKYRYPMACCSVGVQGESFAYRIKFYHSPQQFPQNDLTVEQLLCVHNRLFVEYSLPTNLSPSNHNMTCVIL